MLCHSVTHIFRDALTVVWFMLCAGTFATAVAAPPSIEQVNDALDIAEITAQQGLGDVSAAAVGRALAHGTPAWLRGAEPVDVRQSGVRIDTISPVAPTAAEAIRVRIPRCVLSLSQLWQDTTTPAVAYAALRDVVMPPQRPGLFLLHHFSIKVDPAAPDQLPATRSVAQELVRWAVRADCLRELVRHISDHKNHRSIEGALLTLMCATEIGDDPLIERCSAALLQTIEFGNSRETAELVAAVAAELARRNSGTQPACDLLEAAGRALNRMEALKPVADSPARAILLSAARMHFADDRHQRAVGVLKEYLSVQVRDVNGVKSAGAIERQQQTVGRELFRRGLWQVGCELLDPTIATRLQKKYAAAGLAPASSTERTSTSTEESSKETPRIRSRDQVASRLDDEDIWICRHEIETQESTVLFTLPDFSSVAEPAVCADGRRIAFAATRPGEAVTSGKRLYVTDIDGSSLTCLGRGTLPSWSPRGERLVFSRFAPDGGVWLAHINRNEHALLDDSGWGACWSPDGCRVVYAKPNNGRWNILLRDIVEDETTRLFDKRGAGLGAILGGFSWSADTTRLIYVTSALNATAAPAQQLRFVELSKGASPRNLYASDRRMGRRACWLGESSDAAVCSVRLSRSGPEQLFVIDPEREEAATILAGQIPDRSNSNAAWIPGSRSMIYVSKPAAQR